MPMPFGSGKSELVEVVDKQISNKNIIRKTFLEMPQLKALAFLKYKEGIEKPFIDPKTNEIRTKSVNEIEADLVNLVINGMLSIKGRSQNNIVNSIKSINETLKTIPENQAMGENKGKNF
jgi:hypothetical protein